MTRKKIVFIIVEGPSDDEALGVIFSRAFDKNMVYVEVMHGDITSVKGNHTGNIVGKVGDLLKQYAKSNHYSKSDFLEVIHIMDTDGAFISDENVVEDHSLRTLQYSLSEIRCKDAALIRSRNKQKSENMDKLSRQSQVWDSVPYQCYYMSSNLDHVLHNLLNCSSEDKERNAFLFAKKYKNALGEFLQFLCESDFSVNTSYRESWDFIEEGLHSLERHSNLGLCFKEIRRGE